MREDRTVAHLGYRGAQSGVTLLEMIVVVALISIMIGITFPAVGAGLESLRLRTGADDIVTTFNSALVRAERFQEAVEITISPARRLIETHSLLSNTVHKIELPKGIDIVRIIPAQLLDENSEAAPQPDQRFIVYPNGSVPRIAIDLANRRGTHRLIALDPITGVARETVFSGSFDEKTADEFLSSGTLNGGAAE